MSDIVITNWFGDLVSHPQVVIDIHSKEDIVAALKNPANPSPVRAVGSNHSTARCGVADGGTLLRMKMNRILEISKDTVTVEAGCLYIDIAKELEKHGLQFYVNTEIGNLSAGSAACAGTKDSSFAGEFGQVGSYVTRVKMVLPSGDLLEVERRRTRTDGEDPLQLRVVRHRLRGHLPHPTHTADGGPSQDVSPPGFPHAAPGAEVARLRDDVLPVSFRRPDHGRVPQVQPRRNRASPTAHIWALRNYLWANAGPRFAHDIEQNIADPKIRYAMVDNFCAIWRFKLENIDQTATTRSPPTR